MIRNYKVINYKIIIVSIIFLLAVFSVYSDEESSFGFGLSLGIGATTFHEQDAEEPVTYQLLSLSPDISFGKFGIGLDLPFHFTFTGGEDNTSFEVRKWDWVPQDDETILDVYLPKFKYIRYGLKGEPLFVKLGSIDDATLGNGFIMGNYDNTLFLPEKRIFGLNFDLDGRLFQFPIIGIETFVGNLARFDVFGIRPFVRPLVLTEIPVLEDLQVGATLAMDTQPDLYVEADDAVSVTLYGVDFRLPLVSNPVVSLATFGDIAFLHNRGSAGGMLGFGGRLFGFLTYGAQIRMLGANFIPTYFDSAYDLFRYDKYQIAEQGAGEIPGFVGWLASLGTSFLDDAIVFNVSLDGPFKQPEPLNPDNYLNYPHMYAVFYVQQGIIPNLSFDASYDKRSITSFRDLISAEDAVIQARINYNVGVSILSFVYKIRYDPDAPTGEDPWVVSSGIECSLQLF